MEEEFDQWVYHATEQPKIVKSGEAQKLFKDGWADNPSKFVEMESFGVKKGDEIKEMQVEDVIKGVTESLNGALNLERMNKNELQEYAKKHHGLVVDKRMNNKKILAMIKKAVKG